jgi:hypothetical protein
MARKPKEVPMLKSFDDVQWGDWAKGMQAIATEWSDYNKRAFEQGTQTFEKLLTVKTVEQAIEIQSGYAKRAYEDYVREVTKIGAMYQDLAKDAYKPVEKAFQNGR